MKILQLNLNHCEAAQDLLHQTLRERGIDIAIISEPYKDLDPGIWGTDSTGKAAIWTCGKIPFQSNMAKTEAGFIRATINDIHVYSCYFPPSQSIADFENALDKLVNDARGRSPLIIAGDFNAWAVEWGSRYTNRRGKAVIEALEVLELVLLNNGDTATFSRNGRESMIDLTFVSNPMTAGAAWEVSDIYTHSDHQALIYELPKKANGQSRGHRRVARTQQRGWKEKELDKVLFVETFEIPVFRGTTAEKVAQLMRQVTRACDATMSRKTQNSRSKAMYWWNEEIAELRRRCIRTRRLTQRTRGGEQSDNLQLTHKEARRALKKSIRRSKQASFKKLCDDTDQNPWGMGYRVVMKKLSKFNAPLTTCSSTLRNIVEGLFPEKPDVSFDCRQPQPGEEIPAVTAEEVQQAAQMLKDSKAPGPDGIPNAAIKAAMQAHPQVFAEIYDECLKKGIFPGVWKIQRLVLLPKGLKNMKDPSAYRPLCMLDSAGKVLEKIICNRLEEAKERAGGLAQNQYGFRKARSTTDAIKTVVDTASKAIEGTRWMEGRKEYCAIVTLDVKNAFNSAGWDHILTALQRMSTPSYLMEVIRDYFRSRILLFDTDAGTEKYTVTGGVPQGSVMGPTLWNVMYDEVLRLDLHKRAKTIGFADDLAIVVTAKRVEEITRICNHTIRLVRGWIRSTGLQLAEHKTEAILISSRKLKETITLTIGDQTITSKDEIKYLGVMIDRKLSFQPHLKYAGEKCVRTSRALARIMPNIGGPRQSRRALLAKVTASVALYGATIWAQATTIKEYRKGLESAYRLSTLRVCSAFRTISTDAAGVIAGIIPFDIAAREAARNNERSRDMENPLLETTAGTERDSSIREWQRRWDASPKGRWTHWLIPNIAEWIGRKHGETNYYMTQALSGHGCFREYLFKYQHDISDECPECIGETEGVEHALFWCPRFAGQRRALNNALGTTTAPANLVKLMMSSEKNWMAACSFVTIVMSELRRIERTRATERARANESENLP